MIDWISGFFRLLGPDGRPVAPSSLPKLGRYLREIIDQETGEILRRSFEPHLLWPGVGENKSPARVRVAGERIHVSVNPIRCVQPDNAFSRMLPWETVNAMLGEVLARASIPEHRLVLERVTRLDLTQMVDCDTLGRAALTLNAMRNAWSAPKAHRTTEEHTVYLGLHSHSWSLKAYRKSPDAALEVAPGVDPSEFLRVELRLLSDGMRSAGLDSKSARTWNLVEIFDSYLARCRLPLGSLADGVPLPPQELSNHMRGYWSRWQSGERLKDSLTKATYYRLRRDFLKRGIDIQEPPSRCPGSVVRPLAWDDIRDRRRWHATRFTRENVEASRRLRAASDGRFSSSVLMAEEPLFPLSGQMLSDDAAPDRARCAVGHRGRAARLPLPSIEESDVRERKPSSKAPAGRRRHEPQGGR
jgi:hypothetical protein